MKYEINGQTKVIGRFHSINSSRGLNIYNPLFIELGINSVYLLFYNKNPKILFDGLRNLNLMGAITVGFETDKRLAQLVDKFDDVSKYLGKVGFVKNIKGVLHAYYQGGEGMYRTIRHVTQIKNKKMIIVGAGQVAKALLFIMNKFNDTPTEVVIYNRDLKKAKNLSKEYKFIKNTYSLNKLINAKGDILVNLTNLGGDVKDNLFNKEIVGKYKTIIDVTFETENTNLIKLAKKLKKTYSTGWDMFAYQGQVVLETLLDTKIPYNVLKKHVRNGLRHVVK